MIEGRRRAPPIWPLLANLYFRRFLLAWERFGHRKQLDAYVVNYADDLVICCRPGNGSTALATMRQLTTRLGLTVNETKTRLARLPEENFDFLGYSIGRSYGKDGTVYWHAPVTEGCPALAPAGPRRDDATQAC